jgi:hypothetical protein
MLNTRRLEKINVDKPILVDDLSLIRGNRLDLFLDMGLRFKKLEDFYMKLECFNVILREKYTNRHKKTPTSAILNKDVNT